MESKHSKPNVYSSECIWETVQILSDEKQAFQMNKELQLIKKEMSTAVKRRHKNSLHDDYLLTNSHIATNEASPPSSSLKVKKHKRKTSQVSVASFKTKGKHSVSSVLIQMPGKVKCHKAASGTPTTRHSSLRKKKLETFKNVGEARLEKSYEKGKQRMKTDRKAAESSNNCKYLKLNSERKEFREIRNRIQKAEFTQTQNHSSSLQKLELQHLKERCTKVLNQYSQEVRRLREQNYYLKKQNQILKKKIV